MEHARPREGGQGREGQREGGGQEKRGKSLTHGKGFLLRNLKKGSVKARQVSAHKVAALLVEAALLLRVGVVECAAREPV